MLKYHNTDDLEGKVAASILDMYKSDYKNYSLSSIIAGFHRVYGLRNEGNLISMEIINSISDDTENISQRNILVWNLYGITRELIDDGAYEEAIKVLDRAEKNWSRDLLLGDELGVYHISWIEQLWLRKAEIYLISNDIDSFQKITDRILMNRFELFNKAEKITGETIIFDRCTYSCFEIMALERRKKDIKIANSLIRQALLYKGGIMLEGLNLKSAGKKVSKTQPYNLFNLYLKYFNKMPESSFDNIKYGYCSSCIYYNGDERCKRFNLATDSFRACSQYEN